MLDLECKLTYVVSGTIQKKWQRKNVRIDVRNIIVKQIVAIDVPEKEKK